MAGYNKDLNGQKIDMIYTIRRLGNGWYGFGEIPKPDCKYIVLEARNCMTDQRAINEARRLVGRGANIEIVGAQVDENIQRTK